VDKDFVKYGSGTFPSKFVPKFRIPHNSDDAYEIELAHHPTTTLSIPKCYGLKESRDGTYTIQD
jgi:hypothetical protein